MTMNKTLVTTAVLSVMTLGSVFADETIKINGQVRERSEYSSKQFGNASAVDGSFLHLLRTRLGVTATPSDAATIKVELQDNRAFGSEPPLTNKPSHTKSLGNAGNIDLHQAYFETTTFGIKTKVGRQKTKLGSQRFLSSLEWHNNARAFDGITVNWKGLTALSYLVSDASGADNSQVLSGLFWSKKKALELVDYDVYSFYEHDKMANSDIVWYGERLKLVHPIIIADEEFILQTGEKGEVDISGYYLATRLGAKFGKNSITLGYDIMSGQKDGEGKYLNKYTFAHAYFGWMDRFVVNPAKGVQDIRLDAKIVASPKATIKVGAHYLMEDTDGADGSGDANAYGTELNSEVHLKLFPKSKIVVGASYFMADDKQIDAENSSYLYIMPIFNF
ncbi:MAG: alginate export family protein [Fibrobacterales bacterium]